MSLITGSNGELRYRGVRVAKCREFSIETSRDALDSSTLGSYDREYVEGMRGSTGSATRKNTGDRNVGSLRETTLCINGELTYLGG